MWYLLPFLPQLFFMWRCHLWYLLHLLLGHLSCGDVIYGTSAIYLTTCTTISIACTNISTVDGSTVPLIIFYALASVFSCSFFTHENKALFFLSRALLGKSVVVFFLFSSVFCILSLIPSTLVDDFLDFPFNAQTITEGFLPI